LVSGVMAMFGLRSRWGERQWARALPLSCVYEREREKERETRLKTQDQ